MAKRSEWRSPKIKGIELEVLYTLPFIPPAIYKKLPRSQQLGPPSPAQISAIKQRLNMRAAHKFGRCRGRNKQFIKRAEAKGDFTHSGPHPECGGCMECRCKRVAGAGTKGDFYGLGPETGMLGVGLCSRCAMHKTPGLLLRNARLEVQHLQAYGGAILMADKEYTSKLVQYEAQLAKRSLEIDEDMSRLADEFNKVLGEIEGEEAFEYVQGEKQPLSTAKRAQLIIDLAKARSRLRVDEWKTRRDDNMISVDEALSRTADIMRVFRDTLVTAIELVRAREVRGEDGETTKDPIDYAMEILEAKWYAAWKQGGKR